MGNTHFKTPLVTARRGKFEQNIYSIFTTEDRKRKWLGSRPDLKLKELNIEFMSFPITMSV